ncbi:PEP-CTERM/exosortase system-associated acyltransferase [Thiohalobacter sp. IOR34]|uniref:PEP-CTERM/exosortase system-associated acyltransferase n=1 Tax=Thiohalobacter sp. IOR34 TaxID=3057176 RepID=UPI0025AF2632|nr:PEP-CTERM/exosortase system-associated acyltransferase [Thiohalobacter sp. IOR34]WJW74469.1 PEP-CTERM/exosortase system-associated acyltransferase [Thiohalobacter sp. IOR34]
MQDLQALFLRHFEVVQANEGPLLEQAHALRYQVYCLETGFESAERFSSPHERDEYDERAVHSLIRWRDSGEAHATVRLVLCDEADPSRPFPLEAHCPGVLPSVGSRFGGVPRDTFAEISRFAVSRQALARSVALSRLEGMAAARFIPYLTLGLFRAIVQMSVERCISHWYAVMEPSLLRLLTRFGIVFQPLGGLVDYHGLRQPCVASIDEVLAGIYFKRRDVWMLITDGGRYWSRPWMDEAPRLQVRHTG